MSTYFRTRHMRQLRHLRHFVRNSLNLWTLQLYQVSQLSHAFFTQSKMDAWIDNDYRKMSTFLGKCKHFQEDVKSFRKSHFDLQLPQKFHVTNLTILTNLTISQNLVKLVNFAISFFYNLGLFLFAFSDCILN